ncbi:MAG: metallophosphoesterase [Deltaproteobacteria bacterium]
MITRRTFLRGAGVAIAAGAGSAGYAFGYEPRCRLAVTRYSISPQNWPSGLKLTLALVADVHACEPLMGAQRIESIVELTNGLGADAILLLGDYETNARFIDRPLMPDEWAPILAKLKAPLGVHAILGNHDYWDDPDVQLNRGRPPRGRRALERAGVPVYENDAIRLTKEGRPFWLAGLADQIAYVTTSLDGTKQTQGLDDLDGTLARVTDGSPVILMAHEPDIFSKVPERVALTVSGHTHGGQVRLFGWSPIVPSAYGNRYAYGHVVEGSRQLVVSGGLGCSIVPVRFGMPPEVVVVELGADA